VCLRLQDSVCNEKGGSSGVLPFLCLCRLDGSVGFVQGLELRLVPSGVGVGVELNRWRGMVVLLAWSSDLQRHESKSDEWQGLRGSRGSGHERRNSEGVAALALLNGGMANLVLARVEPASSKARNTSPSGWQAGVRIRGVALLCTHAHLPREELPDGGAGAADVVLRGEVVARAVEVFLPLGVFALLFNQE